MSNGENFSYKNILKEISEVSLRGISESKNTKLLNSNHNAIEIKDLIEIQGRQDYFKLRIIWSRYIILWVSLLMFFTIGLTLAIGLEYLNYDTLE